VFRAWPERLQDPETALDSNEDDAELLITIPFNGAVKIKAISIIGGSDGSSPSRLKAYTNRHDLDFAAVTDMAPVQAWDLQEQQQASMEYPTQSASSASSIEPECATCPARIFKIHLFHYFLPALAASSCRLCDLA